MLLGPPYLLGSHDKDYSLWGSILGSPYLGNYHIRVWGSGVQGLGRGALAVCRKRVEHPGCGWRSCLDLTGPPPAAVVFVAVLCRYCCSKA